MLALAGEDALFLAVLGSASSGGCVDGSSRVPLVKETHCVQVVGFVMFGAAEVDRRSKST